MRIILYFICGWSIVHIRKVRIQNFRSLLDLEVDLENYLSIVVGKNNSGKTSLLLAMERFLEGGTTVRFELDDFNIEFQKRLENLLDEIVLPPEPYAFLGMSLRLFIEYADTDDLGNVGDKVIMDLDPDNHQIVLDFLYHLPAENLAALIRDFKAHKAKKAAENKAAKSASEYLRSELRRHFKLARRSVQFDQATSSVLEDNYVDLIKEHVRVEDIVSFKRINARRSVSNKDSERGLSLMSAKIYQAMDSDAQDGDVIESFKEALSDTDGQLNTIYDNLFKEVIEDVRQFGGIKEGDTQLKVMSSLKHYEMLGENTTVMYGQGAELHVLPESYNGLGYLNLISIIFEIKILLNEFKRGSHSKPADINLLFIEEPEAHTHPQMQAVFIKNIKRLVGRSIKNGQGVERPLQTLLSTHSSHIVAEFEFDDIKYFRKIDGRTRSNNLKDLQALYATTGFPGHYKFLKQYLTLNRSQLFFADKAILVEGDTERILLPAMMRKLDQSNEAASWVAGEIAPLALLSQNISIIEVGAHSQIYEIFLDFIGVKTLIVTDIDSAKDELDFKDGNPVLNQAGEQTSTRKAHPIEGATHTGNFALQFYFGKGPELDYYLTLDALGKTVRKDAANGWGAHVDGQLMCAFQIKENAPDGTEYHARSFEDAFFHVNRAFVAASTPQVPRVSMGFPSLVKKHLTAYLGGGSSYDMADKGISKKPSFAIEILLNSATTTSTQTRPDGIQKTFEHEFHNWNTPRYIEEGLEWIKRN